MSKGDSDQDGDRLRWLTMPVVLAITAAYLAMWAVYGVLVYKTTGLQRGGLFGDMFGAFNALVSGLAMLGVVVAILLQREQNRMQAQELKLQRQELQETREELKGQREALEAQNVHAQAQAQAAQDQLGRWDKDYIERNKPVVFSDRAEDREDRGGNYHYVMRNVGGGFAVNVYFIDAAHPFETPLALGSLAPNAERQMPMAVNRALASAENGLRHLLIAEGPATRTTQWTPTLNFRTADNDIRKGQVQHRVARVQNPSPAGEPQPLRVFLENNRLNLLTQLESLNPSEE
jgi:hypothetical protein